VGQESHSELEGPLQFEQEALQGTQVPDIGKNKEGHFAIQVFWNNRNPVGHEVQFVEVVAHVVQVASHA
jgi:hypothetical protein